MMSSDKERSPRRLFFARRGIGPLLQRDYWALIDSCRLTPEELVDFVACHFEQFVPPDAARFTRNDATRRPLSLGEEVEVRIPGAGYNRVRVLHVDAQSFTFGTIRGHPEAGRITFGAYRNALRDVVFHIRSRARASSRKNYAGFLALGESMQTNCWTGFVNAVACAAGDCVIGSIHAVTTTLSGEERDDEAQVTPTFFARGN